MAGLLVESIKLNGIKNLQNSINIFRMVGVLE